MVHHKKTLLAISLTGIVIAVFVVFFSFKKNPADTPIAPANLSNEFANDSFKVRPLTTIKYEHTAQRLARGRYLAEGLLECFMCHSERNWNAPGAPPLTEKKGSGKILWEDSTNRIVPPNITPDKETGAGTWTDDMLARAIREGVGHDGRALSTQMPYSTFKKLSDEDLASVIVYLRSIPPVHHVVPPTKISAEERLQTEKFLKPITQPVLAPDFSDPVKRGSYLVGLADCGGCHTSHVAYPSPGVYAGGNLIDHGHGKAFSVNITSDPSGMAYGPEGFIFVMRTGKGGTLSHNMPWIVLKNLSDDDLKAIYAYLKTIPPSQHYISNHKPFTHCAICGQEHGLGEKNKLGKPVGIKVNPDVYNQYAGTYLNEDNNFSIIVAKEGSKLIFIPWENGPKIELIPQSAQHFLAPGWYLPFTFVKCENGKIAEMVEDTDEGLVYKKIK